MGIRTFQFGVENSDLSGDPKNLDRVPTWLITGNHINPLGHKESLPTKAFFACRWGVRPEQERLIKRIQKVKDIDLKAG
ncbi:hypothetical protein DWY25_08935 [Holdemania filiformis]|uniref:Uncharacterized protein n=1 Tax=Holdemania filiformis TaxID=61171 RepID=A0A412G190_9FIRM|nr:hypothetical protein DWY25_08935 [Holdemania filiformis]